MEKKKSIKLSVSAFFLLLAIIVIFIMGMFIVKLNVDKSEKIQKATELQAQVNSLNGTINNLQEKINTIAETVNSNTFIQNTTTNNTSTSFTDDQIKTALANYLELDSHAGCAALLECLTEKGDLNYDSTKDTISNEDGMNVTTIKFSDYKKAMLNYVSENEFEKNWSSSQYISTNDDGYLLRPQGGGGLRVYTIKSISKINDTTYSAKTSSVVNDDEYYEDDTFTFTIKSYNGKCVIDSLK